MVLTAKDLEDLQATVSKSLAEALTAQTKTITTQIDTSISAIRKEIIDTLKVENEKLNDKITLLETKNDLLESRISSLEIKLEDNLQYQRNANIIISGIPREIAHEKLESIVIEIFNKVCFHTISDREIVACHRLSMKSDNVLVKFLNKKDALALNGSKVALKELDKSFIPNCGNLYVNEHLTPYASSLSYRCRCLKRTNKIYQTKVENGTVKVLSNRGGIFKWYNIYCDNDINAFDNEEIPKNVNTDSIVDN